MLKAPEVQTQNEFPPLSFNLATVVSKHAIHLRALIFPPLSKPKIGQEQITFRHSYFSPRVRNTYLKLLFQNLLTHIQTTYVRQSKTKFNFEQQNVHITQINS
jgi:hypothetical protein